MRVARAVLDRDTGSYRLGPGWYVRVRRDGDVLKVQATGEDEVPMTAQSDTTFWAESYNAPMTFRAAAGQPTQLVYRNLRVPKLEQAPRLSTAQLAEFTGDYESDELQTRYRVEVRDSGLVMRHPRHGKIRLTQLRPNDFGGSAWFIRSVEFRRDAAGRVAGFSVFVDERSRNVRFTKRR